ncbi:MAG TPA: oligosaccharide flippase family protein [Chthoniobacterales bacterium]|nr:oligosaccharide flippase family protein [Chthoniobacterales bacterium]
MSLAWNILVTLGSRVAILLLSLISSILLARMLGPEGRGLFALVLLLPELATSLASLGFDQAYVVYAGLTPERRRALVWQSGCLAAAVGSVVAIGCIVFLAIGAPGFHFLQKGPFWLYVLALTTVPARLLLTYWGGIVRGMNRILLMNFVDVGTKFVSVSLILAIVGWLRFDVPGAVSVDFALIIGKLIVFVALLVWLGQWGRPSFDLGLWKRTARFALPAYGATIAGYLNYRVDQFIIGALLAPQELAFYVIAVDIAEQLWILTGAVAGPLLPHLTNVPDRDPAVAATVARHVMIWTGGACLIVFLLADLAIRVLYSSAFSPAVGPLRWLLPGILTLSIGKTVVAELVAREKIHYTLWAGIGAVVANIVGNLVLIPRMGISGAALASSISYSVLGLIVTWYYLRETDLPWSALLPRRDDLSAYVTFCRRSVRAFSIASSTSKA